MGPPIGPGPIDGMELIMQTTLIRRAALLGIIAAPLAFSSAAFAEGNWNYARDSWPQIQARLQSENQTNLAANAPQTTDATQSYVAGIAPPDGVRGYGNFTGAFTDNTGVTHYGSHNPMINRSSEY
jgi:hypothetical protein